MITQESFESVYFHDNRLWGIEFLIDSDRFESDIKLDIDYICQWIKPVSGEKYKWKVAPASLVFHGVTGLNLNQ